MRIREYRHDDAGALCAILHAAVHGLGCRDYDPAQLAAWSPSPLSPARFNARVADGRSVFVAVSETDAPLAFIELERGGHIDCFYCHPDVAGTGIGKALYLRLEETAVAAGLARLSVEASEAARRVFLREGFSIVERRDFEIRGVLIHNYAMEKALETGGSREAG